MHVAAAHLPEGRIAALREHHHVEHVTWTIGDLPTARLVGRKPIILYDRDGTTRKNVALTKRRPLTHFKPMTAQQHPRLASSAYALFRRVLGSMMGIRGGFSPLPS